MAITSIICLMAFVIILPGLRNGWYVMHVALVMATSWFLDLVFRLEDFTPAAFAFFFAAHLIMINVVTFIVYEADKRAAWRKTWRVPERTLHAFAFAGGTIAAYFAQKKLRHKTSKKSFKAMFWVLSFLQLSIMLALFFLVYTETGQTILQSFKSRYNF